MKANAYIVAIPKSIGLDTILEFKETPGFITHRDSEANEKCDIYFQMKEILQKLKSNIETDIFGSYNYSAILYYIIDYTKEHGQLLGEIKISGNIDKIINVEADGVKESTKHHILQKGLLDGIVRRLNGL